MAPMSTQRDRAASRVVRGVPGWRRFPPNLFPVPFGLAGLAVGSLCGPVHLHGLAAASFGVWLLSWLLVGSAILSLLFFHAALPPQRPPTRAFGSAPPAVACERRLRTHRLPDRSWAQALAVTLS